MYGLGRSLDNIPTYRLILKATLSIWCFQVRFWSIKFQGISQTLLSRETYLSLWLSIIVIFGWKVSFLWAGQNVTNFLLLIFKVSIFAISWIIWNVSFFKCKTNKVKQSLSSTTASLWIRTRNALYHQHAWLLLSIPKVYLLIDGPKYYIELTFWKMYTQETFKQMNWLYFGVRMIIYILSQG